MLNDDLIIEFRNKLIVTQGEYQRELDYIADVFNDWDDEIEVSVQQYQVAIDALNVLLLGNEIERSSK